MKKRELDQTTHSWIFPLTEATRRRSLCTLAIVMLFCPRLRRAFRLSGEFRLDHKLEGGEPASVNLCNLRRLRLDVKAQVSGL